MLYSKPVEIPLCQPLYRCSSPSHHSLGLIVPQIRSNSPSHHSFSMDPSCSDVTGGKMEERLGYVAATRGGEMLRGLYRCKGGTHALDLQCDEPDGDGIELQYERHVCFEMFY